MGFTFYTHPEIEFFLLTERPEMGAPFKPPSRSTRAATSTTRRTTSAHDFRREAITMLERMGISVEFSHHEVAPGQQEIDLRYADALTTADNIMTFRHVVKEVALEQGVYATFMPKPFSDQPGSAMHTHLSLFEGDRNAFHDPADPLPPVQDGQVVHRRAAASTPPRSPRSPTSGSTPTSGLVGGGEAPSYVCWGHNNRSALVRVPMYKPQQGQLHPGRGPLAGLGVQPLPRVRRAAGRRPEGHRGGLRAAAGRRGGRVGADRRRAHGAWASQALPDSPRRRDHGRWRRSELVAETPRRARLRLLPAQQAQEWEEYRRQVTPFELERYLPVL